MRRYVKLFGTLLAGASIAGLALLAASSAEDSAVTREALRPEPTVAPAEPTPGDAANAASASPSVAPAITPTPFTALLDEHFGDNRMAWVDNRQSTAWLEPGGYHLAARVALQFVTVGAPVSVPLRDVMLSGRFRKVGGPPGGGYGFVVRDQRPTGGDGVSQEGRYYVLEVGDRGEVGIWRRETDHWEDLLPWTASAAVHPGNDANDVEVWAIADRLSLLVNGVEVASQIDSNLERGRVGVFLGGDANEAVLERLLIRTPADTSAPEAAPSSPPPTATPPPGAGLPITRVAIPRTSLDAEAVPARLVDRQGGHTWEVPAYKIGHAEGTAGAGAAGNAVLVGHVTSQSLGNVFNDLDQVQVGDTVQVFSADREFDYQVVDVRTVGRTDLSVVRPTATASVTLMTCTGVWLPVVSDYSQRLVVRAELQSNARAQTP
jgi:LPXTG-site transpeptidase (sortase) family protein